MEKILSFFRWLWTDWHISYVAIAFVGVVYKHSDGDLLQMIAFSKYFSDHLFGGVVLELMLRRRVLISKSRIIPK